jgi:hypothetical protein
MTTIDSGDPRDIAAETERMMRTAKWSDAEPTHFVETFRAMHVLVYHVAALMPANERRKAERLAAETLREHFDNDSSTMAAFVYWTWERESTRAAHPSNFHRPMGWRLQFSPSLVTDWRVAMKRQGHDVGASDTRGSAMSDRPVIVIGPDELRVNDEAVAALASDTDVYSRAGMLVTVIRAPRAKLNGGVARAPGAPSIRALALPTLQEKLASAARFVKVTTEESEAHPPQFVVKAVAARGQWKGIRPLEGVVDCPVLRPDLTVLSEPGYDPPTGLLFEPTVEFPPVPDRPTGEQAAAALAELYEVVADFPFAGSEHRSAWLAMLLSLLARDAIDGPVPGAIIDATTPGTGKGLLADATSELVFGRSAPKMPQCDDEAETRKRIGSLMIEGERFIVIDNVTGPFGDAVIDALLTSTTYRDRRLGKSETVTSTNRMVVAVTGNNVMVRGDTTRRVLHVRLESPLENPHERADFRHRDLIAWTKRERPRLVVAGLTLLRAYAADGCPDLQLLPWGSFDAFTRLVRNVIVWLGEPDPGLTRLELASAADTEKNALRAILAAWSEFGPAGATVKRVLERVQKDGEGFIADMRELADAFVELAPPPMSRSGGSQVKPIQLVNANTLGKKFERFRGRVVGGMALDRRPKSKIGVVWYARSVGTLRPRAGDGGDGGDGLSPGPYAREDHRSRIGGEQKSVTSVTSVTHPPDPPAPVEPLVLGGRRRRQA